MTLMEFVTTLRKRWAYVLAPVVLLAVAVGISSKLETPIYTAKASAYFSLPFGQDASDLFQGSNYTQQQLGSFAALATKPIVLDRVIKSTGVDVSAHQLAQSVTAKAAADSTIIEVSASSADPEQAARLANAVSDSLGKAVQSLSPETAKGTPSIIVTPVAEAEVPSYQSSPNTRRNVLAASIAGLIFGILLALAREVLDTRMRGQSDLPEGVAILGRIGYEKAIRGRDSGSRSGSEDGGSVTRSEAFRKLRTNLRFLDVDTTVKVITVTSSVSGEGKTSTALDLARAVADDGQRVLLIDADMRRPAVADYLSIEGSVGLVDVLTGTIPLDLAVQRLASVKLDVLPSGTIPPNPSELLGSRAMVDQIEELRERYDLVVIDAPPLLPVTDALIAGVKSDGVVMVVRYGKTTRHQFAQSYEALMGVEARVLGVVFNRVPPPRGWRSQSQYVYYEAPRRSESKLSRLTDSVRRSS